MRHLLTFPVFVPDAWKLQAFERNPFSGFCLFTIGNGRWQQQSCQSILVCKDLILMTKRLNIPEVNNVTAAAW